MSIRETFLFVHMLVMGSLVGCSGEDQLAKEKAEMQKPPSPPSAGAPAISASRGAPPMGPFVVFDGIKYRQVLDGQEHGKTQRTGYLAAYEEGGEEPLRLLKVYQTANVEHLGQNVQDVYFTRMALDEDNRQLLIENELGNTFTVDIDSKTVK